MKILEKEGKEARFGQIEWNNRFVLSPMMDSSYQTLKRDYKINLSLLPRFIKPKKDWIHRRNARLEV